MKGGLIALLLCCGAMFSDGLVNPSGTDAMLFDGQTNDPFEGRPKPTSYLRILEVQNDFMLVGARERLYNISLLTMEINAVYIWPVSADHIVYCTNDRTNFGDCHSYVRAVRRLLPDTYLVCASSAKVPMCRKLQYNNTAQMWKLSPVDLYNPDKIALAPVLAWNEIRVLPVNNTVYAASHHIAKGDWCPLLYRSHTYNTAITDGNTFDKSDNVEIPGLKTLCGKHDAFSIDYTAQTSVMYAAIAHNEHYVYLTFSEPAMETWVSRDTRKSTYSRIARICKNDRGRGDRRNSDGEEEKHHFATFFKARMLCGDFDSPASGQSKFISKPFVGYYPTYVDEIADSVMSSVSSIVGADGEEIILAIFNSQSRAANQAAVCAYKVSDVNKVFASKKQIEFGSTYTTYSREADSPPAECYNDSRNITDEQYRSLDDFLLAEPVLPINGKSLFISSVGFRMTRMAVDWQVEGVNGSKYDVMFVATDDGRLIKFVSFVGQYEIVEERQIFSDGSKISEMQLIHDQYGKKHLLLNSLNQIKRVSVEKCHFYTDCQSCIQLQDPYCSWSPKLSRCVSTTHEATDKYQSIKTGISSICSKATEYSVTESTSRPSEASTTKLQVIEGQERGFAPKTGAVLAESNDTTYIALLIVLPLVVGVVAGFLGYMYGKRRYMSQTPHIDRELTTSKGKDDPMCDPYQSLPKPSNLQLMNNLTHQVVPSESTSTLTRQKKVYV